MRVNLQVSNQLTHTFLGRSMGEFPRLTEGEKSFLQGKTFLQGPDINGCEAETPPCPCLLLLLTDECVYLCCCCHQTSDSLGSNVDCRAEAHTPRIFQISDVRLDC